MDWPEALERDGWARWDRTLDEAQVRGLEARLDVPGAFSRRPVPLGTLHDWLSGTALPAAVASVLGPGARVIRAFLLDKTPEENWALAFHQDTTLALAEPGEAEGLWAWVNKAHFYHAQASAELMARILSTRIHLDDAGAEQGALKVLPGTHRLGRVEDALLAGLVAERDALSVPAARGEVLFMRPLLLHGSDRATDPRRRRILHLEWAAFDPPGGLRWAWF